MSMAHIARVTTTMTADEFIVTDQSVFGDDWRYELIDGAIEGNAAPTPTHGVILANLVTALKTRLRAHGERCHAETGSAAAPAREQRNTARIPDALVRCQGLPRVTFEIVSPSELQKIRDRDKKREDVKEVEGVVQIVEVYQHTMAAHIHSKTDTGVWGLVPISGKEAILEIESIGISVPLIEIYENAMPADDGE
jgi:Uma2 family endonuclease